MPLWGYFKEPVWKQDSLPSYQGWRHPDTWELLVWIRDLTGKRRNLSECEVDQILLENGCFLLLEQETDRPLFLLLEQQTP